MAIEVRLPELGEGITGAAVTAVLVKPGDMVGADTGVVEVETEKAAIEVPARATGRVLEVLVKPGDRARVGQALIVLEGTDTSPSPAKAEMPKAKVAGSSPRPATPAAISPSPMPVGEAVAAGEGAPSAPFARKLAREMGVDIRKITGTGPGNRITPEDVAGYARRLLAGSTAGTATPPLPDLARWGEVVREPMTGIRKATAETMTAAGSIPSVTQFDRADITLLESARQLLKRDETNGRVTVTAFVVAAVAKALGEFPVFNSCVDMARGEIITRKYISIGVAVDTPRGLMVPVIRGADGKDFRVIAREMAELAGKARNKKLSVEEMRGGTFSVSNLGGLGTTYFTPLVNWPDVAVLGLGRSALEQVHNGKGFEARMLMPLSLTYDHRVIDGAGAARFLRRIAELLVPVSFGL